MENHFEGYNINHGNYTDKDLEIIKESGNDYNNNIPIKTVEEVFTVSVLEGKIKDTKDIIEAMEKNILDRGVEIPNGTKDLIDTLNNKIRDYAIKLEEIQKKFLN